MLIEFADLLKVSVFKLGTLFMLIRRQFPDDAEVLEIDPSIYIARFAAMLHFGSKTKDVVNDAMKLVRRMKRDWLADGRRPAGICGACLVIAARMHNFHRSVQEIVNIVKMSGVTVKTRLNEFKKTSAANLSTHEFRVHYDCNDVDTPWPPCTKDPRPRKRKRSSTSSTDEKFPETPITSVVESGLKVSLEEETPEEQEKEKEIHVPKENGSDRSTVAKEGQKDQPKVGFNSSSFSSRFTSEVLSLSSSIQPPIDDASLSDLDDDDDIINMLVSPEEASLRASVWYGLNREYLLEQKDREARKSQTKPRLPKPKDPPASNVMEAVHRVAIKNISTKINKSILSQLFQTNQMEPSTVAPAAESGLPNSRYPVPTFEGEHTDMYEVEEEYEEEEDYDEENGTTSGIPNIYELVYDVL
ncbi:transcription factor TFIIIB subunit brf1 [Coelomomyces lativittatus]|nr:transcription factor TFIIIB subunit brf1 [Coelomomyces lativittatus]KAJ1512437.1 transcription factor TFIIIB subunit brf1 [Coelomomyces lativittatus]